jgi:hypothetical protein
MQDLLSFRNAGCGMNIHPKAFQDSLYQSVGVLVRQQKQCRKYVPGSEKPGLPGKDIPS